MKKIGIIYGGRSTEHDASIKSKENICEKVDDIDIVDIVFVNRDGEIFWEDKKVSLGQMIDKISRKKDVYYINLLHGTEGEDGEWSGLLDIANINGNFESVLTSSLLMNKYEQSLIASYDLEKLFIPKSILINYQDDPESIIKKIKMLPSEQLILKPNSMGASHFTFYYDKINMESILHDLKTIFKYDDNAILQEFICGEEYTCGAYMSKDGCQILPIIHVKSNNEVFLGHKTKHNKGLSMVDFADFPQKELVENIVKDLFKLFNIKCMCRFDFIISNGKVFYLEGNLIPGFSKGSAFPQMLVKAGITFDKFFCDISEYMTSLRKKSKFLPYEIND